ncbi:hypothetical protein GGE45_003938 [Rhizobium aethiopicum]|uniref:hypothetical protein n=1 Tax=Rhizobium aethiopicum TaxID=1138170 RepID=UPI00161BEBFA|nr:hypothetical protein [Rhizobium aethiopicum]MBB4581590.1 hypothetical protein [Rhizobium aethiopicum]
MPPEETINPRCEAALKALASKGVPLMCYSVWRRTEVLNLGGDFFTHYVVREGKWLWRGIEREPLVTFDGKHLTAPILDFVDKHPDAGMVIDATNKRVITFDLYGPDLTSAQKVVYEKLKELMTSLVEGSDEFVVDSYDTGLGILRPMSLALQAANARLGWQDRVHLVITGEQGEQSIHKGGQVSLCVKEGRRIKDANGLADVLEWVLSLCPEAETASA